mmetsp:Transcript_24795/g.37799  ORF Transcript_24795/g.37799 Transcript_24795/m.37799 type:complete len:91 (+) Transcript_24795:13-285(+)
MQLKKYKQSGVSRAATAEGRLEISFMDPGICPIFDAFNDWQGFVMCHGVLSAWIVVMDTGPNQCPTSFGLHCNIKVAESSATALFHVVQI